MTALSLAHVCFHIDTHIDVLVDLLLVRSSGMAKASVQDFRRYDPCCSLCADLAEIIAEMIAEMIAS